jgi:hypothetical protein
MKRGLFDFNKDSSPFFALLRPSSMLCERSLIIFVVFIQDFKYMSYKENNSIYLTMEGVKVFANKATHPNAIKNKNDFLTFLEKASSDMKATMHVSSSSASASGIQKGPTPPSGPKLQGEGGQANNTLQDPICEQTYAQSVSENTDALVKFYNAATASGMHSTQSVQGLTTEVVKYGQSVDGCAQKLQGVTTAVVKYGQEMKTTSEEMMNCSKSADVCAQSFVDLKSNADEVKGFMTFVVEKMPAFQEGMNIMLDLKRQNLEVDKRISISAQENAQREVERRQSLLKMAKEEFKFEEYKNDQLKKRNIDDARVEENKKKKQKEQEDEENFITIREVGIKHRHDILKGIPSHDYRVIFLKAGGHCFKAYEDAGKRHLSKIDFNGFSVRRYPKEDEHFVIDALKKAVEEYKQDKANKEMAQHTIPGMLRRGAM